MNMMPYCAKCGTNHFPGIACIEHLQERTSNIVPMKKAMVRVVMRNGGGWFDMDKPDDFNMLNFIMSVKASSSILNEHLYVPHDEIASIFIWTQDNVPKTEGPGAIVPFGEKK